jgi:hypothetical protein
MLFFGWRFENQGGNMSIKCKDCACIFREGDKRQKYTEQDHLKVIKLYLENCGIRSIERLTGIYNRQISLWIERAASWIKAELGKGQQSIKTRALHLYPNNTKMPFFVFVFWPINGKQKNPYIASYARFFPSHF